MLCIIPSCAGGFAEDAYRRDMEGDWIYRLGCSYACKTPHILDGVVPGIVRRDDRLWVPICVSTIFIRLYSFLISIQISFSDCPSVVVNARWRKPDKYLDHANKSSNTLSFLSLILGR